MGDQHGYRNGQVTVLAPTGTIAFMMDCDTTGIEPDIALVKYKKLVGGGMIKIVNNTVPVALRRLGYDETEIQAIVEYIDEHDTIEGAPHLADEHLPVFDCAFKPANGARSIHYMGHVKMIGAVQPFLSGAISKTVNMPEDATVEEIAEAYIEGWKLGLKAVAIYRDGCKRTQPLSTRRGGKVQTGAEDRSARRRKLPDERQALTHKFSIAGHEGYLTVGLYEDGQPGEIFLVMAKEGSTISGLMDAFATAISHRPAVRRAAADAGRQVHPHALRALGVHQQPRDPDRQVDHGLHLPLAGVQVPQPRGSAGGRRRAARRAAGQGRRPRSRGGAAQGGVPLPAGRAQLSRLRVDHGAQRHLLQMHELWLHERL